MPENNLTFSDRDEYERRGIANKIAILLEKEIPISPIVIDGKFGQGKTEFCYKLINLLKEKGHKCIYIDSFKNDHTNDPLLTIYSAVISKIDDPDTKRDLKNAILPVLGFGLRTLGKAGISWALKKDPDMLADEFENIVNEAGDVALNAISKKLISDHQKEEGRLLALKGALERATKENKLIVFIDELDRCRPSYAVETLEKIKHVFDISSITFVIITNLQQLQASINNIYGERIIAGDYINKFVNLTIRLNIKSGQKGLTALNSLKHFKVLAGESDGISFALNDGNPLYGLSKYFIETHHLSLRQVERFATRLKIFEVLSSVPLGERSYGLGLITLALIFIDYSIPDLADNIENGSFSGAMINDFLNMEKARSNQQASAIDYYSAINELMDLDNPEKWEGLSKTHLGQIQNGFFPLSHSIGLRHAIKEIYMEQIREVRLN